MSVLHPEADCSSFTDLQILVSRLPCHNHNKSSVTKASRFFWEFCSEPFETVFNLDLEGCLYEKYEIKQNLLQSKFPKLQTLKLKNVNLTTSVVKFPWTNVYVESPDNLYISYLSSHYESFVKNASSFPREITIKNSDVNLDNVIFIGDISAIILNSIHLKQLNGNAFRNVSGLRRFNLSFNELKTIAENVFTTLTKLQYLSLRMNKLTVLSSNVFDNLHNLLLLDLSYNKIKALNQSQIKYLMKLEEVNLDHNEISQLPKDFLKDQTDSIRTVKMSWNPLERIPANALYSDKITKISISHCRINTNSLLTLLETVNHNDLTASYTSYSASRVGPDFPLDGKYFLRRSIFDLSFNLIGNLENAVTSPSLMLKFQDIIQMFYISLNGNPLDCTCMSNIPDIISETNKYSFTATNWVCMYPLELKGRLVSSVTTADTYCPVLIANCPRRCSCFERENERTTDDNNKTCSTFIVDCRNINVTRMPEIMPSGKLELWFENASLTEITAYAYLSHTSVLDLSHNRLNLLTPAVANAMTNLTFLKLDHNNLTRLPIQIMSANIGKLTLGNNPFVCDCYTLWMKSWLLTRTSPVIDWNTIECSYNSSKVNQLTSVADSFFVCRFGSNMSISEHITFPAIVIGCSMFVLISISLLIYFQRFTIKVLLFMHFGIHVFDKQKHIDESQEFDTFVLYSYTDSEFVQENIVKGLVVNGYTVCNLYEDLIVGLTFLGNIEQIISKSRKIIFSVAEDTFTDDLLMSAWNIAYERSISNFTDCIILIIDSQIVNKCEDIKLKKYIKSGNFIERKSKILQSSVLYLMPTLIRDRNGENGDIEELCIPMLEDRRNSVNDFNNSFVYISYPDESDYKIRKELIPYLQVKKYDIRIFEDDFIPGTDIRDEIHEKLNQADHFIFILSSKNLQDEIKMFILSTLISKSVHCNGNFLLLFTSGSIDSSCLSNELDNYFHRNVTASVTDPKFKTRLLTALR